MSHVTHSCRTCDQITSASHVSHMTGGMSYIRQIVRHDSLIWPYKIHSASMFMLQGGQDSYDFLSCRSYSTKEPLNIGHFSGRWPVKIRDPVSLRHPVQTLVMSHIPVSNVTRSYERVLSSIYLAACLTCPHMTKCEIWLAHMIISNSQRLHAPVINMSHVTHSCLTCDQIIWASHV